MKQRRYRFMGREYTEERLFNDWDAEAARFCVPYRDDILSALENVGDSKAIEVGCTSFMLTRIQ